MDLLSVENQPKKVSSLPKREKKNWRELNQGRQVYPAAMYTGLLPCCGGK
jgi:hypothetical protein